MQGLCVRFYMLVYALLSHTTYVQQRTYRISVEQTNKSREKNDKQPTKTNTNKTNQRPTRHDHTRTTTNTTHARLPNHNNNTKNPRHILWTKHHLPNAKLDGKERIPKKRLGHDS